MKGKLKRFAINEQRENIIQPGKEWYETCKGRWREFFQNDNPITIELACGRGEYSVALAEKFPNRNYIGVDIKGDRLWKGSTIAVEKGLKNVAFLRIPILHILHFFEAGEVDEIWLTFPDPRPRKRDVKRRLTSEGFLSFYKTIAKQGAWFRFKTDNEALFTYTLDALNLRHDIQHLQWTRALYGSPLEAECFNIQTYYEKMFSDKGASICYLRFQFL